MYQSDTTISVETHNPLSPIDLAVVQNWVLVLIVFIVAVLIGIMIPTVMYWRDVLNGNRSQYRINEMKYRTQQYEAEKQAHQRKVEAFDSEKNVLNLKEKLTKSAAFNPDDNT